LPNVTGVLKEIQTMNELGASGSITIGAPIDEVWKAITTPDLIKQWFFGVDTESDWKPGGHLIHRGEGRASHMWTRERS
jgi:uncharacterized protein YndB with AHSA1/START domain